MSDRTFLQQFASQYAWQSAPAKRRFRFRKVLNHGMQEEHRLALTLRGVIDRSIDDDEGLQSSDYSTYQIFEQGNLVFKLIDLENIKTSRVGYVPRRGIMSPAYIRLEKTSSAAWPRYYYWFFYAAYLNNIFNGMGGGVRQNLTPTDLLEFPVPLPDLETQKAIADFLDRETARIDQLIEKKRLLFQVLGERRSACLRLAVSGGATDQPSIATRSVWFPSIPDTWRIARLKDVCVKISDGPHISPEYVDDGIPFISARNVKVNRWQLDDAKYISRELFDELSRKSRPQIGDVLYTKGGTTGVARAVDLDFEFHIWVHVALLKLRPRLIDPYYLAYALNSVGCYEQSQLFTRGATNNDLGLNRMALIEFPLPDLAEQKRIVAILDEQTQQIDSLRGKIVVSLDRLEFLRVALITQAVTGGIDVAGLERRGQSQRHLDEIEARPQRKEARA